MALVFSGEAAQRVRHPRRRCCSPPASALLGRWLLGVPSAVLAWPLRRLGRARPAREHRPGGQPLAHRGARDADRADRDAGRRPRACSRPATSATPSRSTAERVTADHVVVGRDGAPLPAGTAAELAGLPASARRGRCRPRCSSSTTGSGWDTPVAGRRHVDRRAGAALDPRVARRPARRSRQRVAVSGVVAPRGPSERRRRDPVRMADTATPRRCASPPIYERAAGIGHVLLDPRSPAATPARRDDGGVRRRGPAAGRSLAPLRRRAPGRAGARPAPSTSSTVHAVHNDRPWGVWLIIGMSLAFAALALDQHRRDGHQPSAAASSRPSACSAARRPGHRA